MSSTKYVAGIDGLRAIAVMTVLLFHVGISAFGGRLCGGGCIFCNQWLSDHKLDH